MNRKTIALLIVALMALAVVSAAGVVAADYGRNNFRDNDRVIKVPLFLEKRDERHKFIGWVWLKKANRDDRGMNDRRDRYNNVFSALIWVKRNADIDRGTFALNAEKKIRDDRRDDRFTRDLTLKIIKIDRWTTFPLEIWVKIPGSALRYPGNLILELQKIRFGNGRFYNGLDPTGNNLRFGNGRFYNGLDPTGNNQVPSTLPGNNQVPSTLPGNNQVPSTLPGNNQVPSTLPGNNQVP